MPTDRQPRIGSTDLSSCVALGVGSLLAVLAWFCGCSPKPSIAPPAPPPQSSQLPARLDAYFEAYCDDMGSLGIGFVASHTFDYRFRHHLKGTQDPELKRLYVLQHLHREVEWSLRDFKEGVIRTGKSSYRPLTLPEWQAAKQSLLTRIDDLATYSAFTNFATVSKSNPDLFDPGMDAAWITELQKTLQSVTSAPPASP